MFILWCSLGYIDLNGSKSKWPHHDKGLLLYSILLYRRYRLVQLFIKKVTDFSDGKKKMETK